MHSPIFLGVNVDHVATLRQARGERYPDPVAAALVAERSGADSITVHLREDRRHIQDHDVVRLQASTQTRVNLEMAVTDAMLGFAREVGPTDCCLVPEKREELTTEGGLDVAGAQARIKDAVDALPGIRVSLFIDADRAQIDAAAASGAPVIELQTGHYALARGGEVGNELARIREASRYAASLGLTVHAGHGLTRHNVQAIAAIPEIVELNIGHALIADSVFEGLPAAVTEMKRLMVEART